MNPSTQILEGTPEAIASLPAILMIGIFLVMTSLMYLRKISALLALPIMAVAFAVVGLVRLRDAWAILNECGGAAGAMQAALMAGAWIVLLAGSIYARRKGMLAPMLALALPPVALLAAILLNLSLLASLTVHHGWGRLFACLEIKTILDDIVHKGALRLHEAYTVAFFGGMLAIFIKEKRLAETLIKYAAELAGDRPLVVAVVMMLATFMLFTTLGGLGAIIMVGSIILPIMLSLGLSPTVAAGVFLIGICAGGTFNPIGWAMYQDTLKCKVEDIQKFAVVMILLYLTTGCVFVGLSLRGKRRRRRWSLASPEDSSPASSLPSSSALKVRPLALLSPIVPIILVFKLSTFSQLFKYVESVSGFLWLEWIVIGIPGIAMSTMGALKLMDSRRTQAGIPGCLIAGAMFLVVHLSILFSPMAVMLSLHQHLIAILAGFTRLAQFWDKYLGGWAFVPAFLAGLIFCMITTWEPKGGNVRVLTKAAIEGAESVMPAVLLMCGIGMLLQVVQNKQVGAYLQPLLAAVTPPPGLAYVIGFGIAAPLALYRGPLNVWGLGLGIGTVMLGTGRLSAALLMGMFMAVGAVQGVCDPTNTHNVWIANFLGEDVLAITRFLLPYIWAMVFVGLAISAFLF